MINSIKFADIELEWDDYCWRGSFSFWSGGEIEVLTLDEEYIQPSSNQLNAWLEFEKKRNDIYPKILDSVFIYYKEMRPKYVAAGGEWAVGMPEIFSTSDLDKMISIQSIHISSPYEGEEMCIGLLFSCDWDSEHGLGVVLNNLNIEKVGGADCAVLV